MERGPAAALILGAAVYFGGLADLGLKGFELHQQTAELFLLVSELLLTAGQLHLQSVLFELEDCTDLLDFLVLEGLQLNPHFFSHLHVLTLRHVLIVKDVDIGHSLRLKVAVKLSAPLC